MMMTCDPTFRSRLWRWTKRLSLVTTVAVVTVIPAAGFGIPVAARSSWARVRVEKALTRSLGAPVQVSSMAWSWKSGLTLREVASTKDGTAFKIETVHLQPRYGKLLQGKLRARATLDTPEVTLADPASAAASALHFPRFAKKGLRIDKIDIRNGSVLLNAAGQNIRLSEIETLGAGRLEDRTLRLALSSVSGTCDGLPFSGKGTLRVSQEGLEGELDLKEAAAIESGSLQKALRALHLTIKKAPVLSEPF